MDYQTLIKLCKKYNIEYRNHYGKSKSYIKLKRKDDEYQHITNKKHKSDNTTYCQYFKSTTMNSKRLSGFILVIFEILFHV